MVAKVGFFEVQKALILGVIFWPTFKIYRMRYDKNLSTYVIKCEESKYARILLKFSILKKILWQKFFGGRVFFDTLPKPNLPVDRSKSSFKWRSAQPRTEFYNIIS